MGKPSAKTQQAFVVAGAVVTWLAIVLQFYLIIVNRSTSLLETVTRFFTFFTILTNILAALCFTAVSLKPKPGWRNFFSKTNTLAATTVYILVVGAVYNIILRFLWQPQGLQRVVDELLHLFNPLFFAVYWLAFAPKSGLQWKNVLPWLWYPLIYLVVVIIRGNFSGYYPYPFMDVNTLGFNKVLVNCGLVFIVFLVLSLLVVAIGRMMSRPAT
jgi:hypothetical protein